jgi:hypothetical protein
MGQGLLVVVNTQNRTFGFHPPSAIRWLMAIGRGANRKPAEAFLYMKNFRSDMHAKKFSRNCKVPPMLMGLFGHCLLPYAVHPNILRVLREMS